MLQRKLVRDLGTWRGQVLAIAAVAACGIMSFVTMQSNFDAMNRAQHEYYASYHFADVFASITRAPLVLANRIAAIPSVAALQPRVVTDVLADLPGRSDAATVRLIGIPDGTEPRLNAVHIVRGRLPMERSRDEVIVSEAFAKANGLDPGSSLKVIINGRQERLAVVGIGLSPEYVYEMRGGGEVFPDSRHFGIAWMNQTPLAAAFDMTGAFNDISIELRAHEQQAAAIAAIDRILAPYGSLGAYGREDQYSARFVANELSQLRAQAIAIPLIFLGIAAFLTNASLARLIATQREQIAILKAFGFGNARIAMHYMEAALFAVLLGGVAGVAGGWWLGYRLAVLYTNFFRFPQTAFYLEPWVALTAVGVSLIAALAGAASAVHAAVTLAPAEAMRPPSPPVYRATLVERMRLSRFLSPPLLMILRTIERRPVSSALTAIAVAFAVAILVVGRSTYDSVEHLMSVQFSEVSREDATLAFVRPLNARGRFEIRALPGVLAVEPFRTAYARISKNGRSRRLAIIGLADRPALHRIVDARGRVVEPPLHGVVLTTALARILGVEAGETVHVDVLEGRRPHFVLRVTALADELIGLNVYVRAEELHRLLGEAGSISGAYVRVDPRFWSAFNAAVKTTPNISGVGFRAAALDEFRRSFSESIGISAAFILTFAMVIASGVIYNSARVALSERSRELATLRILGYTLREVSLMLVGEQALLTAVAIPIGFAIGYGLDRALQPLYELEYYRVPLVTTRISFVLAAAFTIVAATASSLLIAVAIRRVDLVEALKARE